MVREVGWIIESVERVLRANPLQVSRVLNFKTGTTVYSRTELLMHPENGLIGQAYTALREAWFGEHSDRLIVIQYEKLARDPRGVLKLLYQLLGEPWFEHDFDNVEFDEPDYDADLGVPGLHKVRPSVKFEERRPFIPPDIFAKYANAAFWLRPEENPTRATII